MQTIKIILTTLLISCSTIKAQQIKNLSDRLWSFDKKLRTLKQADTVNFSPADIFLIDAWRFSKAGTIDSCAQERFCERKKGRTSTGVKCNWKKFANWTTTTDALKIVLNKNFLVLKTISSTAETIKFVVSSIDPVK